MGFNCCLCAKEYLDNRRRKKLNGHSCSEAKEILAQLIPLHSISETSANDTILCHQCEKLLKDLRSLESKLLNVKTEMTELVNGLLSRHGLLLDVSPPPKRSRQDPATPIPSVSAAHLPTTSAQTQPPSLSSPSVEVDLININRFICIITIIGYSALCSACPKL